MSDTDSVVVVRKYGLLAPTNWGEDVTDELRRMNRLWNTLVEIDRYFRAEYRRIVGESQALSVLTEQILKIETERKTLIEQRGKRRAAARSKEKAGTEFLDARIKSIKAELSPLYASRKMLAKEAKEQQKLVLDAMETERREFVKIARQHSGCFWSNYNAVIDSFSVARVKAMKDGVDLRFHRFDGSGRLVNQIIGGLSVDGLFSRENTQIGIRMESYRRGTLYVTAYTGRDADGKHIRRNVEFPIVLHRPIPDGSVIKSASVGIEHIGGKPRYHVTFTCRAASNGEPASGTAAAGINLGWKQVRGGLRVATAVYSDGGNPEHLILPGDYIASMEYVHKLHGDIDARANDMHAALRNSLAGIRNPDDGAMEGLSVDDHHLLYRIWRATRPPTRAMDALAWRMKDIPNLPLVAGMDLETWRKWHKRTGQEMDNLRDKLLARRQDMYRVFASHVANRAGYVVVDDTDYREAAMVEHHDGSDPDLHETARSNRFVAAPFELRLLIKQAIEKRGGKFERSGEKINNCHQCGSHTISGDIVRQCHACGAVFDTDENAARNLLSTLDAQKQAAA